MCACRSPELLRLVWGGVDPASLGRRWGHLVLHAALQELQRCGSTPHTCVIRLGFNNTNHNPLGSYPGDGSGVHSTLGGWQQR